MNPDLARLQPYPFEKLNRLKEGLLPPEIPHIPLSIGEPQDPAPEFALAAYRDAAAGLMKYPTTRGTLSLRQAISRWLIRRFQLADQALDPERHVLPVNGTREALFAFAQCVIDRHGPKPATVFMPNPFYQIYEGAALLAGARPQFLDCLPENDYLPDFSAIPDREWDACQLLYLCSPGNPTGAVIPTATLQFLISKAQQHNFVIASDECYSEIYADENQPPPGLLQAAWEMGNTDFRQCMVFHSLSKRSNLPGLRSGFVAGDADILDAFFRYRTYHGCAMPLQTQQVSELAWLDEAHVETNRQRYRQKFDAVLAELEPVISIRRPAAGFYLWPHIPVDDERFAAELFARQHVTVLPGQYLSRETEGINPGAGHVRMALVASQEDCVEAARRIRQYIESI